MDAGQFFHEITNHSLHARRAYLSDQIRARTGSIVQHGILKGFEVPVSHWAEIVASAYILGTYEVAVCAVLDALKSPDKTLVDLGGADGVFGLGLVKVGAFGQSVVFEHDEAARARLEERRVAYGIADRVSILDAATRNFPTRVCDLGHDPTRQVILCDIEGAEFDLFDASVFEALSEAHLIIECHDFLLNDPSRAATAVEKLKHVASVTHHVYEIKDGLRDIRNIPLLEGWSDWDAWLTCVEVRYRMMRWLWLEPRAAPPRGERDVDQLILDYQREMVR